MTEPVDTPQAGSLAEEPALEQDTPEGRFKRFLHTIDAIGMGFNAHRIGIHSASVSFFVFLSLAPLLLLLLTILSFLELDLNSLLDFLYRILPASAENLLNNILAGAVTDSYTLLAGLRKTSTLIAAGVSFLIVVWSSSKFFNALINGLEEIYGKKTPSAYLPRRVRAILYTMAMLLGMIVLLFALVFSGRLVDFLTPYAPHVAHLISWVTQGSYILILILEWLVFGGIYRWASSTHRPYGSHLPGAAVATIMCTGFSWIFTKYIAFVASLGAFGAYLAYGTVGTIIVAMLWMWVCVWCFFVGASFNYEAKTWLRWLKGDNADMPRRLSLGKTTYDLE